MTAGAAVSAAVLEGDDEEGKESFGMKGNEKEEEEEEEKEQQGEKVNTKQLLIITTERAADLVHSKWLSLSLSFSLTCTLLLLLYFGRPERQQIRQGSSNGCRSEGMDGGWKKEEQSLKKKEKEVVNLVTTGIS